MGGALTIGEVARRAGVAVETVRYYERLGLIPPPPRKASGYRLYPEDTVRRIRFIRHAKELGFSLREVAELLALRLEPTTPCAQVKRRVQEKLQDIQRRMQALQRIEKTLEELLGACREGAPITQCPILEALEDTERGGKRHG
jgi:MerR family mercuric resistance operon transcriptional regulator